MNPNLETAQNLWNAIAAGNADALVEVLAPESEWVMPGRGPLAGKYTGHQEIIELLARVGELSDDLQSNLIDVFVSKNGAILRYAIHAIRGGRILDTEHLFRVEVKDGLITKAIFTPTDQGLYDDFWVDDVIRPAFGPRVIARDDQA